MLADINTNALNTATAGLTAAGRQAIGVTCDVADEAQAAAMVEHTVATYGRLDMAFNNAGVVGFTGDLAEETAESFDTRDVDQPARHLDLHETRAAPDADARNRSHRELFLARRSGRPGGPGHVPRNQARRDRADQERRDGLCAAWHPHQRRLPGRDRHPHVLGHDREPARTR